MYRLLTGAARRWGCKRIRMFRYEVHSTQRRSSEAYPSHWSNKYWPATQVGDEHVVQTPLGLLTVRRT